jgi:hypothetical protein
MTLHPKFKQKYDPQPVYIEPIYRDTFTVPFTKTLGSPFKLDVDGVLDSNTFVLEAGHTVAQNDFLVVVDEGIVYLGDVLGVAGQNITVDNPLNKNFSKETSVVLRTTKNLAVNGTAGPGNVEKFEVAVPGLNVWSITRLLITMKCSGTPDDGLFGNLPRLENGLVFRTERNEDQRNNRANFKDNGDIRDVCYDVNYSPRSGGQGTYGLAARYTISREGNTSLLFGKSNDKILAIVQDDLSGLVEFNITCGLTEIPQ